MECQQTIDELLNWILINDRLNIDKKTSSQNIII
mgnify:CR=1 FL=1